MNELGRQRLPRAFIALWVVSLFEVLVVYSIPRGWLLSEALALFYLAAVTGWAAQAVSRKLSSRHSYIGWALVILLFILPFVFGTLKGQIRAAITWGTEFTIGGFFLLTFHHAFFEEVIFRFLLLDLLIRRFKFNTVGSIFASCLIFQLGHLSVEPMHFFYGVYFSLVFLYFQSILICALAHCVVNLLLMFEKCEKLIPVCRVSAANQLDQIPLFLSSVVLLLIFCHFVFLLIWVLRKHNVDERLSANYLAANWSR
jgi:membrane protease YdiL (CAAX protease family)